MTAIRSLLCLALVALVAATTGCSTRVRESESAAGFTDQLSATPTVGVITVTVDPNVNGILSEADQADADDALYGSLIAAERGIEVWHPTTVAALVGAETVSALTDEYTRYARLRRDHLLPLAAPLEGCRYLAIGRLTEDRVGTNTQKQTSSDPEARAEGQPEHGDPWRSIASVERRVRVTVEFFDLSTGESVWRAEATSSDKQLYEYDDASVGDPDAYLKRHLAAADRPVYLSRHGDALKLPDLVVLMRKAFTKLFESLPRAGS